MENLISVSEYAQLYHKDPGNIRRYLASGRLRGQKIGNQWVIPKDAPYPNDERQKSGKYRNWRKKVSLNSNRTLMASIKTMSEELSVIYGDSLRKIIIYGSYARGAQTEESDVDIALILHKKPTKVMTDKMIDCVARHEVDCDKVLSVIDIQSDQYDNWKTSLPFYMNIDKEGITVWKAK